MSSSPPSIPKLRSDPEHFDTLSLIIEEPHFDFFESREFFLSEDATCSAPASLQLRSVPNSTDAKRAQLDQRFKVKQIQDALRTAKDQDLSSAKGPRGCEMSTEKLKARMPICAPEVSFTSFWQHSNRWKLPRLSCTCSLRSRQTRGMGTISAVFCSPGDPPPPS